MVILLPSLYTRAMRKRISIEARSRVYTQGGYPPTPLLLLLPLLLLPPSPLTRLAVLCAVLVLERDLATLKLLSNQRLRGKKRGIYELWE